MRKRTESGLVSKLQGGRSLREFRQYLNENIPAGMPGTTTHASVWNWINNVHPVTDVCLMAWLTYYQDGDDRHQLAVDILALRTGMDIMAGVLAREPAQ